MRQKRRCHLTAGIIAILVIAMTLTKEAHCKTGNGGKGEDKATQVIFVTYPDPTAPEMIRMLRELGKAYQKENPQVEVKFHRAIPYTTARSRVLNQKADAMLITRRMNKIRIEKAKDDEGEIRNCLLKSFTPMFRKEIRSRKKVLDSVIMGALTKRSAGAEIKRSTSLTENSNEDKEGLGDELLKDMSEQPPPYSEAYGEFLDFIRSERGKNIVEQFDYVSVIEQEKGDGERE